VTTIDAKRGDAGDANDSVVARAARAGFSLRSRTTDTGQTVWEWHRGDEPRPKFVTARVARHWMSEWLATHEKGR